MQRENWWRVPGIRGSEFGSLRLVKLKDGHLFIDYSWNSTRSPTSGPMQKILSLLLHNKSIKKDEEVERSDGRALSLQLVRNALFHVE